jgi:hypothetical protein
LDHGGCHEARGSTSGALYNVPNSARGRLVRKERCFLCLREANTHERQRDGDAYSVVLETKTVIVHSDPWGDRGQTSIHWSDCAGPRINHRAVQQTRSQKSTRGLARPFLWLVAFPVPWPTRCVNACHRRSSSSQTRATMHHPVDALSGVLHITPLACRLARKGCHARLLSCKFRSSPIACLMTNTKRL